ncbi:type II secretion system F family protein [Pseudoduganella ginsengisoli]|uniref:Type II secretion system F family protein n=1 Tax=Pseudoduganella ginsengisoli TaxID=1462440 RepID=A0A6L6Q1H2_9BURK|nr:type II secretion system F family protein [Pseudoduganella ginsengisoli]MTW03485.1 type II secretion system F family protein [Pseudoduganella ginsengisoli]
MNGPMAVFLLLVFLVVAAIVMLALWLFAPDAVRLRLNGQLLDPDAQPVEGQGKWVERIARVAQPLTRLSLPDEGWERSPLRTRFITAGWRQQSAPTLYFAAKTMLALLLPALAALPAASHVPQNAWLLLLLGAAAIGYYLPNAVLARTAARRQREIFENLPDALDLLTVCVEAGLSLERALVRVAAEIHIKSVALAQELQLTLMEMRAGFSKEKALRNLALRSGVEDMDTLVAMLIQSQRFGTSMGDSLRVHSENLRTKRRMMAEEAAAKIGLKLLFPLIFCIFPTLMLVLLGPAALQVARVLMPGLLK